MLEERGSLGLEELDRHRENQREAALANILRGKVLDKTSTNTLVEYWKLHLRKSEEYEEPGHLKILVDKLRKDVDLLKELRLTLKLARKDPVIDAQEPALARIIHVLEIILEKLERRWWLLRGKFWALYAALNPALPKKHLQHEKAGRKEKLQAQPIEATKKKGDDTDTE